MRVHAGARFAILDTIDVRQRLDHWNTDSSARNVRCVAFMLGAWVVSGFSQLSRICCSFTFSADGWTTLRLMSSEAHSNIRLVQALDHRANTKLLKCFCCRPTFRSQPAVRAGSTSRADATDPLPCNQSTDRSIYQSPHPSIHPSIRPPIHPSIHPSI